MHVNLQTTQMPRQGVSFLVVPESGLQAVEGVLQVEVPLRCVLQNPVDLSLGAGDRRCVHAKKNTDRNPCPLTAQWQKTRGGQNNVKNVKIET